jgi:Zn finger protein HypA/HybF involved in hydrogenase expression
MHDFFLAKEIIDEVLKIVAEKKPVTVLSVKVEIGSIALAHDGFPEHAEDIDLGNLEFALKGIAEKTVLRDTKFIISKVPGENWKITDLEVE